MPNVTLPINDEEFHKIAAQVLADSLSQSVKEQLVRDALTLALRPSTSIYGTRSTLQIAYDNAINTLVKDEVEKLIATDTAVIDKVRAEVRTMAEHLTSSKYGLAEAFANAVVSAIKAQ